MKMKNQISHSDIDKSLSDGTLELRNKLEEIMNFNPKRNKFNAQSCVYNGYKYHSKKEASYAMELDWLIKANLVVKYERQYKLDLRVNDQHICKYYIDFKVWYSDGHIEYVEVKGFETDLWRLKWRITEATFDEMTKGENARLTLIK